MIPDKILLIDKPVEWTSFDVVAKIRGMLRQAQKQGTLSVTHENKMQGAGKERTEVYKNYSEGAQKPATQQFVSSQIGVESSARKQDLAMRMPRVKVGHTGTLDPFATGLMIILVGNATKDAQKYSKLEKTYEVEMTLGQTSSTGDPEGQLTKISTRVPEQSEVEQMLISFAGEVEQIPPKFSAIKVGGKRAYELARAGKEVNIEPRKVLIYGIELKNYSYPKVLFNCRVSSGTYVRTLCEDIGTKLNTGAYCSALTRTKVGDFDIKDAIRIEKLSYSDLQKQLHLRS